MKIKKILIVSMSVGAGHVQAGNALLEELQKNHPDIISEHIDINTLIYSPLRKAAVSSYDILIRRLPSLWGYLFEKSDNPKMLKKFNRLTKRIKQINSTKFYQFIKNYNPDYIISTHFLASDIIINSPEKFACQCPVSVVITDYDVHSLWVMGGIEHYFVATEKIKWKLEKRNINSDKITVSGIPIQAWFYDNNDVQTSITEKLNLNNPTILVLSGGQGLIALDNITRSLYKIKQPLNIIAVAGKNKKLYRLLTKLEAPKNINLIPLGWTDEMPALMNLAAVVVSKPGGLTTTECMVAGTPIITIDPIPGQEEYNTLFILEHNLGRVAKTQEDLCYYVEHYLKQKKAHPLPFPKATEIILSKIFKAD